MEECQAAFRARSGAGALRRPSVTSMARCLYDPADCESERTVIISELQGGENDPDSFLDQELTATAFKAHPYRHPTIGWLADLQAMTRDDLFGHYRRHYAPDNATLVIVGDVNAEEALERTRHHFGDIEPGGRIPRMGGLFDAPLAVLVTRLP